MTKQELECEWERRGRVTNSEIVREKYNTRTFKNSFWYSVSQQKLTNTPNNFYIHLRVEKVTIDHFFHAERR